MRKMLSQIKHPLQRVWGDGAYDDRKLYKDLYQRKIYPVIPPSVNATESYSYKQRAFMGRRRPLIYRHPELEPRDEAIRFIQQFSNKHHGKQVWKQQSGYYLRSLVEMTFMRFKRQLGDKLRSRKLSHQQTEIKLKCAILNKMLDVGIPYTQPIPCKHLP